MVGQSLGKKIFSSGGSDISNAGSTTDFIWSYLSKMQLHDPLNALKHCPANGLGLSILPIDPPHTQIPLNQEIWWSLGSSLFKIVLSSHIEVDLKSQVWLKHLKQRLMNYDIPQLY